MAVFLYIDNHIKQKREKQQQQRRQTELPFDGVKVADNERMYMKNFITTQSHHKTRL